MGCVLHSRAKGAGEAAAAARALEARVVAMDVGAASGTSALGVEDRAATRLEGQAHELVLWRLGATARASPCRDVSRRYSSASPVGSADSGAGSRPGSLAAATVASSVTSASSASSSSSPVSAVTSSVSKSTSAWWAGRPQ